MLEKNLVIDHGMRNVFRVSGGDATEWLQRMLTADVNAVRDGRGAHGLMLDCLGKIQADLAVVGANGGYYLALLGGDPELVARHMKRLIVMEDVEVSLVSGRLLSFHGDASHIAGHFENDGFSLVRFEIAELFPEGAMLAFEMSPESVGSLLARTGLPVADSETWETLRIERGIPSLWTGFHQCGQSWPSRIASNCRKHDEGLLSWTRGRLQARDAWRAARTDLSVEVRRYSNNRQCRLP
ncbi:MAG: hypothetical protein QM784_12225 [Polyangiaceae bacterium]